MTAGLKSTRRTLRGALGPGAGLLAAALLWFGVAGCQEKANIVAAGDGPGYTLKASSYLDGEMPSGNADGEQVRDVAIDAAGHVYIVGGAQSPNLPVTEGAYDTSLGRGGSSPGQFGAMDAFVAKVDPEGRLLWMTYLGGPNYDRAYAVEVDATGHVYVAGRAGEAFPTTPGAAQTRFGGGTGDPRHGYGHQDGFVSKLSPDGRDLVWSTYFGGPSNGFIRDIDVGAQGKVYIGATAVTLPLPHITANAAQRELKGHEDAVYAKLSADGGKVLYATYYGGSDGENGEDGVNPSVRVNDRGEVYFLAFTAADDVPVTAQAYQTRRAGATDLILAKYSAAGALLFSTYLGGREGEGIETHGLALDGEGNPILAGGTSSPDFPMTRGAFQPALGGGSDGFIAKLSSDGTQLLAATYLGGAEGDWVEGIGVAPGGGIVVTGGTGSTDFPITGNALQTRLRGDSDFMVARLDTDLTRVLYSTFIGGGGGREEGRSLAVSRTGEIVAGGDTMSSDFPLVNGFHRSLNGERAGVYVRLAPKPQ